MSELRRREAPVTADEAYAFASLSRFITSHFGKAEREHARFSIPANPADLIDRLAEATYDGEASPAARAVARAVLNALRRESPEVVAEALGLQVRMEPHE
jgi:hypothetical protein